MLNDLQTDQLLQTIQHAFPSLVVSRRTSHTTGEHMVIVRTATNFNEIRITSMQTDWQASVTTMHKLS